MSEWAGFTEKELQRLKTSDDGRPSRSKDSAKRQSAPHKQVIPERRQARTNNSVDSLSNDLPPEAFMKKTSPSKDLENPSLGNSTQEESTSGINSSASPPADDPRSSSVTDSQKDVSTDSGRVPLNLPLENEPQLVDSPVLDLNSYHQNQLEIEEKNKQTVSLLKKTLNQRFEKTHTEAELLSSIKKELSKLDSFLSNDVFILRDKIEEANRKFESARKRYVAAETEYINAKVSLQKATEEKELLAEHLYTIIQQNEARKAQRLAELMQKLKTNGVPLLSENDALASPEILPSQTLQKTPPPIICKSQLSKVLGASVMPEKSSQSNSDKMDNDHSPVTTDVTIQDS